MKLSQSIYHTFASAWPIDQSEARFRKPKLNSLYGEFTPKTPANHLNTPGTLSDNARRCKKSRVLPPSTSFALAPLSANPFFLEDVDYTDAEHCTFPSDGESCESLSTGETTPHGSPEEFATFVKKAHSVLRPDQALTAADDDLASIREDGMKDIEGTNPVLSTEWPTIAEGLKYSSVKNRIKKGETSPVVDATREVGTPLAYSSMDEYCSVYSEHLYEELLFDVEPVMLSRFAELRLGPGGSFSLCVGYSSALKRLVPSEQRTYIKHPFKTGQCVFMVIDNSAFPFEVETVDVKKDCKRGGWIESVNLTLACYPWIDPVKIQSPNSRLFIVPGNAATSRITMAMKNIYNLSEDSFQKKLLMGCGTVNYAQVTTCPPSASPTEKKLGESQAEAVQHALSHAVTLVRGPSGSGKTFTICTLVEELVSRGETPINIATATNLAADRVAEQLKDKAQVNFLRIVCGAQESGYTEEHALSSKLLHLREVERLSKESKDVYVKIQEGHHEQITEPEYAEYLTERQVITKELMGAVPVFVTTTITAGGRQFVEMSKVNTVIIDESAQATEASTLILLGKPGLTRAVFVGDERQLGCASRVPFLEGSLFERVLNNGLCHSILTLQNQYRIHPTISSFTNTMFYGAPRGKLVSDGSQSVCPLRFFDYGVDRAEVSCDQSQGRTYTNPGEALLLVNVLRDLLTCGEFQRSQIAVLTPYSGQRDLIARTIQACSTLNPRRKPIAEGGLAHKAKGSSTKVVGELVVSSVDAFQCMERDVIVLCCVRSNTDFNIGFLGNERRITVALTRANKLLIVLGNSRCLGQNEVWRDFIKHAHVVGEVVTP